MAERRQDARFALGFPMDAHVSVIQDVQVEPAGTEDINVLSAVAGVRGEELTVRIGPSDAVQMTLVARTLSSEPRVVDGRVRHSIRLAITGAIALSSGIAAAGNSWRSDELSSAVLVRRYPTRILNFSRGGCLLELSAGLPAGTVATLHTSDGAVAAEPIRIESLRERRGLSWTYVAGAEFLVLDAPSSRSLRSMAARVEAEQAGTSLPAAGDESGEALTSSALDIDDEQAVGASNDGLHIEERARSPIPTDSSRWQRTKREYPRRT